MEVPNPPKKPTYREICEKYPLTSSEWFVVGMLVGGFAMLMIKLFLP